MFSNKKKKVIQEPHEKHVIHEACSGKISPRLKKPIAAIHITVVKLIVAVKPTDVAVTTVATFNHHRSMLSANSSFCTYLCLWVWEEKRRKEKRKIE